MIQSQKTFALRSLALALACCSASSAARAERIWWDGSRDAENAPPGKLLSDNAGYWGDSVLTGVTYRYQAAPDDPADVIPNTPEFGNRLLNGVPQGDWHQPVGLANRPLVAIFDFKRSCTFAELDISTRSQRVALKIEAADEEAGPWRTAYDRPLAQSPDKMFQRVPLPHKPMGRYLRLTVNAADARANISQTFLEEVLVWGEAPATPSTPEVIRPIGPTPVSSGGSLPSLSSISGAPRTSFSDEAWKEWRGQLGAWARLPAVWSQVPTWDSITDKPLLPLAGAIGQPVSITMARNEAEYAALALSNTSLGNSVADKVTLGPFRKVGGASGAEAGGAEAGGAKAGGAAIRGSVRVAGAMASRQLGINAVPLFSADNRIGASLMRRYLTNGESLQDFPRLKLAPAGSAVLWVQVVTEGAAPGIYEASLSFGARSEIKVRVQVLDATLPRPFVWLQTWSGTTGMFPFVYGDRMAREVGYKQSLGITVWNELPTPGSAAEMARKRGRTFHQPYLLPTHYVDAGYNNRLKAGDLTAKDEAAIGEHVRGVVKAAQAQGLSYDDWAGELWDEPGRGSVALFGALARIIKKADPKVRIYSNPVFWEDGFAADEVVHDMLAPWYSEQVDASVPNEMLLRPRSLPLFNARRPINAFYSVSSHVAKGEKSERVELYRRHAWDSFSRGWNGWGFYSYYAPRADPWNDFDTREMDYMIVYPGPRGPIPTRASEAVRQGWEEYCLLTLLKEQHRTAEIAALLKDYAGGEAPEKLRLRALRLAATPQPAAGKRR
ncbi:MAG TPA: hypothetical protein VNM48_09815 [Chloroflexota bacterium]|nr:hypothetical protein [Chloroflexota bacterium]